MAKGFKKGAYYPLNFKLVGNPKPETAKENTIWINTDTPITGYAFSAAEPAEPVEGVVYITVGKISTAAFSATKKNPVMVYPLHARQCIDGVLVAKTAMSWQNEKWVNWWNGELYISGDEFEAVTGGVSEWLYSKTSDIQGPGTATKTKDYINIKCSSKKGLAVGPENKIDLTNYSKLMLNVVDYGGSLTSSRCGLSVSTTRDETTGNNRVSNKAISGKGLVTLDISDLTGEYYVYVHVWCVYVESGAYSLSFDKFYLE